MSSENNENHFMSGVRLFLDVVAAHMLYLTRIRFTFTVLASTNTTRCSGGISYSLYLYRKFTMDYTIEHRCAAENWRNFTELRHRTHLSKVTIQ